MGDELRKMKVAAVQAASVFLDREASVEKACRLIAEAGEAAAELIGFPEGFIPAHPTWYHFRLVRAPAAMSMAKRLFQNAVEIPGPATDKLCEACRSAGITAVIGMCEKRPGTLGTMFNTQLFIGPDGRILGKHQKLVPTVGERVVHQGGYGDTLKAYEAPFGVVSGLVCAENRNPLAAHVMGCMSPVVHVASWPDFFAAPHELKDSVPTATRGLACMLGCFVIASSGVLTDEVIEVYEPTDEEREFLGANKDKGHTIIVNPRGGVVAGPFGAGEGILYADIDLNDAVAAKLFFDFAGHYNRFDVLSLSVNTKAPAPVTFIGDEADGEGEAENMAIDGEG